MQAYNVYRSDRPYIRLGLVWAASESNAIAIAKELRIDTAPLVCADSNCNRFGQPSSAYLEHLRRIAASHDGEKAL